MVETAAAGAEWNNAPPTNYDVGRGWSWQTYFDTYYAEPREVASRDLTAHRAKVHGTVLRQTGTAQELLPL